MRIFSDGSKMPDELYVKFVLGLTRALSVDGDGTSIRLAETIKHAKYLNVGSKSLLDDWNKTAYQNIIYQTFMDELIRLNTERVFGINDEIEVPKIVEEYIIKYTSAENKA